MLNKNELTLVEEVTDRLLSEQDVMVLDIRNSTIGAPDLMVMVPRRMPVFLYLAPELMKKSLRKQLEDMDCAWFYVEKVEDVDFLLDTIRRLRKAGEIRQPKTAASEGFEPKQRPRWQD
jgi:hypothetical protein